MTEAGYSVTFDCYDCVKWEEYWCDIDNQDSYNEMINDIKYAAREYGGGSAYIYDGDGELIETWTIAPRPAAIYQQGEEVSFLLDGKLYNGIIEIVDKFGTFFDNSEPYYDIYAVIQERKTLVKHVRQSCVRRVNNV